MVLFKSCPKCETGDLLKSEDMFGEYVECVQCGYVKDISKEIKPAPRRLDIPAATSWDTQGWSA
ncbi:MAG: hypothetical protein V3S98_00520 [Dehalococcoidia bacterium]